MNKLSQNNVFTLFWVTRRRTKVRRVAKFVYSIKLIICQTFAFLRLLKFYFSLFLLFSSFFSFYALCTFFTSPFLRLHNSTKLLHDGKKSLWKRDKSRFVQEKLHLVAEIIGKCKKLFWFFSIFVKKYFITYWFFYTPVV